MRTLIVILLALCASIASVDAQRTTRSRLKPSVVENKTTHELFDTVAVAADSAAIGFSGYEKLLTSTKESFFVTNNTDSAITRLVVKIEYLDMKRRLLDSRIATIDLDLSPGETRKVDISSWDRQKVFYYYRSRQPKVAQATPYRVRMTLDVALRHK